MAIIIKYNIKNFDGYIRNLNVYPDKISYTKFKYKAQKFKSFSDFIFKYSTSQVGKTKERGSIYDRYTEEQI